MVLMLSGCETAPKGNISELTDYSWSGRYLADETEFVIFMPEIKQNYGFGYTPRGSMLDIKHDGKTITMKKRSKNVA